MTVASIATFTALLSHVVAGGVVPGWAGIFAPWVLAVAVSSLLAGRNLSRVRLALSVGASQLFFHALFVMGAPSAGVTSMTMHQHMHGAMTTIPAATDPTVAALCADPWMWIGHGIAAAVTIVALYHGERAVRVLLELARDLRAWAQRAVSRGAFAVSWPSRVRHACTSSAPSVLPAAYLALRTFGGGEARRVGFGG
ncbi:hypothetical protein [Microbacterium lacticum]